MNFTLQMNKNVGLRDFLTPRWALILVGLAIGGSVGLYEIFIGHLLSTSHVLVWTTPLITYFFLALASAGISIVFAYGSLINNPAIKANSRFLLVLDLALLLGGFTALATELGSLLNMINIFLSPNPTSPIWWMGNFYSVKLAVVAIKLLREVLGIHGALDRPLSWVTVLIAAAAALTMGAALGTAIGRPDFQGVYTSLLFLVIGLTSGVAWIVLLSANAPLSQQMNSVARQLAGVLAVMILLDLIYDSRATNVGLMGWVHPLMVLLFVATAIGGAWVPRLSAAVSVAGTFWALFSFVIAGQLWVLGANTSFFGHVATFRPNLAEAATLLLGLSVAALVYNVGRLFLLQGVDVKVKAA